MTMLDRENYKKELANHEPVFPSDLIAQAAADFQDAMRDLALSSAVIENRIAMLCSPVFSSRIDTLAVTAKPGTGILLVINPEFFSLRLGPEDRKKALVHEALHVINRHLCTDYSGASWTTSTEVMCNKTLMEILNVGMFQAHPKADDGAIDSSTTEEFGVVPRKVWEQYRDDLKKQGKEHLSFAAFSKDDLTCMKALDEMSKPPRPPRGTSASEWGCSHTGDGGDELPFDQDEIDDAMDEVLDAAARKAGADNDQRFKDALKRIFDQAGDSERAQKIWGDHGLGELFGETVKKRQVAFWAQWLRRNLGSRLVPGRNLVFNKKTVAVDHQLKRDPILAYKGRQRRTLLWVCVDTSGSMSIEQLDWVRKYVGEEKKIDVEYFNFDTDLVPINYGDSFQGRGGTNFSCIEEGFLAARKKPDAVLVVSDGHAPEIKPKDSKRWVWLITDEGDDWPRRNGMSCFKLPPPN